MVDPEKWAESLLAAGIEPTSDLLNQLTTCLWAPVEPYRMQWLKRWGWHQDGRLDAAMVVLGMREPGAPFD